MSVQVFLVDDHPVLRKGLSEIISKHPGLNCVGDAPNGAASLTAVEELKPDVVVVDIHLPDISGIELVRKILAIHPNAKIIMYSGDSSRDLVDEALEAGASGYIWKPNAAEELIRAIEMSLEGRLYLSAELSAGILADYRTQLAEGQSGRNVLTDRDIYLLRSVADGQRNKEIAAKWNTTPKSVEAHRARLMKKLECNSPAELVRYAIREGIIQA